MAKLLRKKSDKRIKSISFKSLDEKDLSASKFPTRYLVGLNDSSLNHKVIREKRKKEELEVAVIWAMREADSTHIFFEPLYGSYAKPSYIKSIRIKDRDRNSFIGEWFFTDKKGMKKLVRINKLINYSTHKDFNNENIQI